MEKYITEKDNKVLSRVIVEVNDLKFTIESLYSDFNMLDGMMQCIESVIKHYNIDMKSVIKEMKSVLNKENPSYQYKKYGELGKYTIKITTEQYDSRHICESFGGINFLYDLIKCMMDCAVLTTFLPSTVDGYIEEYIEEKEDFLSSEENEKFEDCDDRRWVVDKDDEDEDAKEHITVKD